MGHHNTECLNCSQYSYLKKSLGYKNFFSDRRFALKYNFIEYLIIIGNKNGPNYNKQTKAAYLGFF